MNRPLSILCRCLPLLALALAGGGCLNLRPAADPTRHFLLTPLIPMPETPTLGMGPTAFGLGPVTVPVYLENPWLAVRKGEEEIVYIEDYHWAERLDEGVDRALAVNLTRLLGRDRLHFGAWLRETVDYELHPTVSQFEPDENGKVLLRAQWTIALPGGVKVIDAGRALIERQGPKPDLDPGGSVRAMSEALAELSRQLHEHLTTLPAVRAAPP